VTRPPAARASQTTLRLIALVIALGIVTAIVFAIALSMYGTIATELSYRLLIIGDILLTVMIIVFAALVLSLVKFIEARLGAASPPRPAQMPPPAYHYPPPLLQPPRAQPAPQVPMPPQMQQERTEETTPSALLKPVSKPAVKPEQQQS